MIEDYEIESFEDESLNWEKGIRYLSQVELERLQTVPEGYTSILSRNDAACLLGRRIIWL